MTLTTITSLTTITTDKSADPPAPKMILCKFNYTTMKNLESAEKKARLLTTVVIDKLVKSTCRSCRTLETELHVRHGFIKAV